MAGLHDFPVLFTVDGSSRHEIILVNPGHDLDQLKKAMETLVASSPNAAEVLFQYKANKAQDTIREVRVKWATEGRDKSLFPKETLITDDNCEAVLRMMAIGGGKDVLDVKLLSKKA